jgi:hypothetical protein
MEKFSVFDNEINDSKSVMFEIYPYEVPGNIV